MNERTRMILFVAIAAAVLFSWTPLMRFLGLAPERAPLATTRPAATAPADPAATIPPGVQGAPGVTQFTTPVAPIVPPAAVKPLSDAGLPTTPVSIGSSNEGDPGYAMELSINPVGGGISKVVLNQYKDDDTKTKTRFAFQHPYSSPRTTPLSTRSVTIASVTQDISSAVWKVEKTERTATLSLDLANPDGQPLVRLIKIFQIAPRSEGGDQGPGGYEVRFSQSVVNITAASANPRDLDTSTVIVGPTFPPSNQPSGGDRQVIAGYKGKNSVILYHDLVENFTTDAPTKDYTKDKDGQRLLWIGAGGNYFNGIFRPEGEWIKAAKAEAVNPDSEPLKRDVLLTIETESTGALAPNKDKSHSANLFFGPRLRTLLHNDYYTARDVEYNHTLEISGSCAYCTFQWLVDWLMKLLGFFHMIFKDWGLAIIALVFVVRALLHPITKRSQINMAKMSKMGPEMERIKKKYGDDKEGMNRAMLEFYKNHGAAPVLGCLPMFLQMPIWIALYSGLSTTFELRQEPFLYGLTWIKDLAKPDLLIELAPEHHINFLFLHIDGLHVMPILLAFVFYFQFKLQPKPPTMTPEQEQQQKMMKWMTTLLFPVMLYQSPSGLTIYILASTTFGIIESKIIRKHIDDAEAAKASAKFVDGEIVDRSKPEASKKPNRLISMFAKAQQWADQQRQEAEKQAQKKKKNK
ncbi:MAG: YidC/Oxa1 family insertase periplasmic-domain containing protein [Burkholderiales bacterium]|nr:YidC/Oxa1 family insertase periplasmic-domain containing protein [Phycisphaerae bacterium]